MACVVRPQQLSQAVRVCDPAAVTKVVRTLTAARAEAIAAERFDGDRNVLHICASMASTGLVAPQPRGGKSVPDRSVHKTSRASTVAKVTAIVKTICTAPILRPVLGQILSHRDVLGRTPFLALVQARAFDAAEKVVTAALECIGESGDTVRPPPSKSILPPSHPPSAMIPSNGDAACLGCMSRFLRYSSSASGLWLISLFVHPASGLRLISLFVHPASGLRLSSISTTFTSRL